MAILVGGDLTASRAFMPQDSLWEQIRIVFGDATCCAKVVGDAAKALIIAINRKAKAPDIVGSRTAHTRKFWRSLDGKMLASAQNDAIHVMI